MEIFKCNDCNKSTTSLTSTKFQQETNMKLLLYTADNIDIIDGAIPVPGQENYILVPAQYDSTNDDVIRTGNVEMYCSVASFSTNQIMISFGEEKTTKQQVKHIVGSGYIDATPIEIDVDTCDTWSVELEPEINPDIKVEEIKQQHKNSNMFKFVEPDRHHVYIGDGSTIVICDECQRNNGSPRK